MADDDIEIPWGNPPPPPQSRWGQGTPTSPAPKPGEDGSVELPWHEPPSVMSDVGKSIAGQGTLGLADNAGMIGSMGQLYDLAADKLTKWGLTAAKSIPPVPGLTAPGHYPLWGDVQGETGGQDKSADETYEAMKKLREADMSPAEKSGDVNKIFGAPVITGKGVQGIVQKALPFTQYEPETTAGKIAGNVARTGASMAEFGLPAAIPAAASAARTAWPLVTDLASGMGAAAKTVSPFVKDFFTGAAAGAGSETAGTLAQDKSMEWLDPYARFFGAVAGGAGVNGLTRAVSHFVAPSEVAKQELADALGKDMRTGKGRMSPQQIDEAMASGASPTIYDMAGPQTVATLKKYGYMTEESQEALGKMSKVLDQRTAEASANLGEHINGTYGGSLDAAALKAQTEAANTAVNDAVYKIARESPKAASISSPVLDQLAQIDPIKQAIRKTERIATDPELGIVLPKAGTPSKTVTSPITGPDGSPITSTVPGTPAVGGNLSYWDQVKRSLDDQMSAAIQGGRRDEARRLKLLKGRLVGELDSAVPEYATARDVASEGFGASNAIEAGYNAAKGMSAFKSKEVTDALAKMSPNQQAMFAQGTASYLKEIAENKGVDTVTRMMERPAIADRLRKSLGDSNFESIYGRAKAESLLSDVKSIPAPPPHTSGHGAGWFAGIGAAATGLLHGEIPLDPSTLAVMGAGAAGGLGVRTVMNAAEKNIAPKLLELAQSGRPEDIAELGRMASQSAAAKSALSKMQENARQAAMYYYRSNPGADQNPERLGRKSGGRATVNHAAVAARLVREVEKTRKHISKGTEKFLDLPDNVITKALAVANRHTV